MAERDWKDIIKFYESFGDDKTWKELKWMKKFVSHLIE